MAIAVFQGKHIWAEREKKGGASQNRMDAYTPYFCTDDGPLDIVSFAIRRTKISLGLSVRLLSKADRVNFIESLVTTKDWTKHLVMEPGKISKHPFMQASVKKIPGR